MSDSFVFRPTEAHLLAALRMHYDRFQVKRFLFFIVFCALLGVADAGFSSDAGVTKILMTSGGIFIFGCIAEILIHTWWMPSYARRIFKQQADLDQDTEVLWDAEHFATKTPNSHMRQPWADFHSWGRNEKVMVLYRSEALFNFFPLDDAAKCLAAAQFEALLVNARVKPRS